jgi:hypothetical protein
MPGTRTTANTVVARETVVINVDGRAPERREVTVTDRRTGERVTILDTDNDPVDPGDEGTPFAFKAGERVPKNHPAVKANPAAFMTLEEAEESEA